MRLGSAKAMGKGAISPEFYLNTMLLIFFSAYSFSTHAFDIYDSTLYENKPSLSAYGVKPMTVIYGHKTYENNKSTNELPNRNTIDKIAKKLSATEKMVVLDYEHWPTQGYRHIPLLMTNNRQKYKTLIDWYKASAPQVKFGYFGVVPVSNYISSLSDPGSRRFREWTEDNQNMRELAAEIDVAFVEAYTYDDSHIDWLKSLDAHLSQLRKIYSGKTYLFLWPQYFDHAPTPEPLRLKYIPADVWRAQLEAASTRADGVVIWGGWDLPGAKPQTWDESAAWWLETKNFLSIRQAPPSAPEALQPAAQ